MIKLFYSVPCVPFTIRLYKPVSDWLEMFSHRTAGLNNVRVFSIGHK